jgi:hypothetical protein
MYQEMFSKIYAYCFVFDLFLLYKKKLAQTSTAEIVSNIWFCT